MSWRISEGRVRLLSRAPPCSSDEKRLCMPSFSNSSALRDSVRWGISISLARSPAVSWNRTSGRIASYNSCSGQSVHCLILAHSSVRSRRDRFGPGISPSLPIQRCSLQAYPIARKFARIQGQVSQYSLLIFAHYVMRWSRAYVLPHGTVHQNHAWNIDHLHVGIDALSPNIHII